jgi:hypothetical protein
MIFNPTSQNVTMYVLCEFGGILLWWLIVCIVFILYLFYCIYSKNK